MMSDWEEFFLGDDLEAYSCFREGRGRLVISFDPMQQISRPPHVTAASFFQEEGCDQIHIVSKKDIWYQTTEIFAVTDLISKLKANYDTIVTYGNSMGAYGAILVSGAVDADIVIAFAPQYSVNPQIMPNEKRWKETTSSNTYIYDDLSSLISYKAKIYLIYDPLCQPDLYHVKAFRLLRPFCEVALPMSGHFPAHFLKEIDHLGLFMRTMLEGGCFSKDHRQMVRSGRSKSKTYFHRVAQLLALRHDIDGAIKAATQTYVLDPDDYESLMIFFNILYWTPKYYAIVDMAARMLTLNYPENPAFKAYSHDARTRLIQHWERKH